ncbi:MAG: hypothetical protein K2F64_05190 [Muribaculaceae bacterium]|nr:hypothetical protein [Muribaculaceae bacterium]
MKKLFLAMALLGTFACANAEETYAPQQGDLSTEIQFSPFKSDGNTFSMQALQLRYFLTDKDAVLFEIGLGGDNYKTIPDTEHKEAFTKGYNGLFKIDLGYQRHFYQYKRIDLYAGGKIGYIHEFAGSTVQADADNKVWKNHNDDGITGNGFEIYATTGIDFYVYKGLYVGAEINLGFTDVLASKSVTKTTINGTETESKSKNGGHYFTGGFDVNPKVRLGWTF